MQKMLFLLIACSSLSIMGQPGPGRNSITPMRALPQPQPTAANPDDTLPQYTLPHNQGSRMADNTAIKNCLQKCSINPVIPPIILIADLICLAPACICRPCKDRGHSANDGFCYWTRTYTCNGNHQDVTFCCCDVSTHSDSCSDAHGFDCGAGCDGCCDCCD